MGQGGELDWRGEGAAAIVVIDGVHKDLLNRRNSEGGDSLVVGNAPGDMIEFDSTTIPSAIHSLQIEAGENIALGTLDRLGRIQAPNVFDPPRNELQRILEELISDEEGGELEAFERKSPTDPISGVLILLDLGNRFGVEKIRFYPRNTWKPSPTTPLETDFIRAFDLSINDGIALTASGNPIWGVPLVKERDNRDPIVEIELDPPRVIQYIRLASRTPIDFEIDEFEVLGKGFLPSSRYISDIFDAGQPAIWDKLSWIETAIGDSRLSSLEIRTRTGSDPSYFVFTRRRRGQPTAEPIPFSVQDPTREMDLAEYLSDWPKRDTVSRDWDPGPVKDDLVNWSGFSAPYKESAANGPPVSILSPSPRRYFQFQVTCVSDDLDAVRALRSLTVGVLRPAMADELIAEIFPREVKLSETVSFAYAVRARMETDGLGGFDIIEIRTPAKVESIDDVRISNAEGEVIAGREFTGLEDRSAIAGFQIISVGDDGFSLRLPPVEDNALILIHFKSQVLTYSTTFAGMVRRSDEPGIAQPAASGNATTLANDDDPDFSRTTVLSPDALKGGRLLDEIELIPNPFTPNGDQINDELSVRYNILFLGIGRRVNVGVYDLSGRLLRIIRDNQERSGRYEATWDGHDAHGETVPPGMYIVRISVEGDNIGEGQSRSVALVY